ncbi:MAG: DUF3810 domain-containing protein [Ruminococcus sp.]|nr:DUF3810 domain-containing protein [Ruminococcus sp.]
MKKRYIIPLIICAVMIALNVISWLSTPFSDFYVMHIFPYISDIFSFISGIFPFSLGEVMIVALLVFIAVGLPVFAVLIIALKRHRRTLAGILSLSVLWILTYVITTETLNCFIMYHCTPFSERYFSSSEHTRSEITQLYEILINESNKLAEEVSRDENGCFVLSCDTDSEAKQAMKKAAEKYPQLSGYYPDAKPIGSSYFMSQSGLLGIYFPFSLEANHNDDMYKVNLPNTLCHEYAHLKGIIQEDEAGFIAFIAATGSDNADFRYSGYLNALEYVHNQIYEKEISEAFYLTDTISGNVKTDWFTFMPENYWEENKEKEIISTETVDTISSAATDTTLKLNGVEDGIESYSRIVNLLLDYYFPPENN